MRVWVWGGGGGSVGPRLLQKHSRNAAGGSCSPMLHTLATPEDGKRSREGPSNRAVVAPLPADPHLLALLGKHRPRHGQHAGRRPAPPDAQRLQRRGEQRRHISALARDLLGGAIIMGRSVGALRGLRHHVREGSRPPLRFPLLGLQDPGRGQK